MTMVLMRARMTMMVRMMKSYQELGVVEVEDKCARVDERAVY